MKRAQNEEDHQEHTAHTNENTGGNSVQQQTGGALHTRARRLLGARSEHYLARVAREQHHTIRVLNTFACVPAARPQFGVNVRAHAAILARIRSAVVHILIALNTAPTCMGT